MIFSHLFISGEMSGPNLSQYGDSSGLSMSGSSPSADGLDMGGEIFGLLCVVPYSGGADPAILSDHDRRPCPSIGVAELAGLSLKGVCHEICDLQFFS